MSTTQDTPISTGRGSSKAPKSPKAPSRFNAGRIAAWAVLWFFILLTIIPFYWMLRTGLSNNRALAANSSSWLPADFTLGAFKRVLGFATAEEAQAEGGSGASINFWLYLRNSIIVATAITLGQVVFSAMAAYAFARLRWPGRGRAAARLRGSQRATRARGHRSARTPSRPDRSSGSRHTLRSRRSGSSAGSGPGCTRGR